MGVLGARGGTAMRTTGVYGLWGEMIPTGMLYHISGPHFVRTM